MDNKYESHSNYYVENRVVALEPRHARHLVALVLVFLVAFLYVVRDAHRALSELSRQADAATFQAVYLQSVSDSLTRIRSIGPDRKGGKLSVPKFEPDIAPQSIRYSPEYITPVPNPIRRDDAWSNPCTDEYLGLPRVKS